MNGLRDGEVLRQLAVMVGAGVPAVEAFRRAGGEHLAGGPGALRQLGRGRDLAGALTAAGVVSKAEGVRLAAAEAAGLTAAALTELAASRERRARRRRRLAGRLLLPLAVLAIAVVAGTAVAAFSPTANAGPVLAANLATTLAVGLLMMALLALAGRDAWWWTTLAWRLGLQHRPLARSAWEATWLTLLLHQLLAGRDAAAALAAMAGLVPARAHERALAAARSRVAAGAGLTAALHDSGLLRDPQTAAVLGAGEAAGRLTASGLHHAALIADALAEWVDAADAWLARGLYVIAALAALGMVRPG